MAVDIVDLTRFYDGPLGAHVQARLAHAISRIWTQNAASNEAVLAYGYGLPLADILWPEADWHFLMPAQQGALAAKQGDPPLTLGEEGRWPLRAESVNRLIMLHGLEAANHLDAVMEEAWRVLVPNGRALFIVANRRGFWARRDGTPFGMGRPFSSGQLRQLMRRTGFVPGQTRPALMLPPFLSERFLTPLLWADRMAGLLVPQLGGVWLMEAVKKVPAPTGSKMALRYRSAAVIRPALSPVKLPMQNKHALLGK
jgi:SAM-dependent methyltransferase